MRKMNDKKISEDGRSSELKSTNVTQGGIEKLLQQRV